MIFAIPIEIFRWMPSKPVACCFQSSLDECGDFIQVQVTVPE
jgi:hypothetical protein